MTSYYADECHADGRPSNVEYEKYVYLVADVEAAMPKREQIQQLRTLARIVRRYAASCDPAPVLDKDADAIDAALAAFEKLRPHEG
jgi:hypothetical protein